jgi:ATP-dependent DNA helicase RecG
MSRACREHGIEPPAFDFSMSGLMLTFRANPDQIGQVRKAESASTPETTLETTPETTPEKIVALLRSRSSITRREMAERIGITLEGVRYHLTKLKAAGRIRHVGPTKAGRWEVLK